MEMIDIALVRFLHIVAGVGWVGVGFTLVAILHPLSSMMGQQGQLLVARFYAKSSIGRWMPIFAVVTTVAGLYVYGRLMMIASGPWLSSTGFWVLTIGTGFGLLAFGHGIATMSKATRQVQEAVAPIGDEFPTENQLSALATAEKYMFTHSRISFILAFLALVFMSGARYLP